MSKSLAIDVAFRKRIGQRIRKERKRIMESQVMFSFHVGITNVQLSGIENGRYMPRTDTIAAICKYCKVSADSLLEIIL